MKTHVVCSLYGNSGRILVNIGPLKRGKYGVRIEGIIDTKDDESTFNLDVAGASTGLIETRTKYKGKIDPHAVAIDLEIELRVDAANLIIALNITYAPGKEIALFILGRRGEGHVDPQIVDNINYYEKIKIPEYKSFMAGDRRKSIRMTNGVDTRNPVHPISKIVLQIQTLFYKDSFGHFRFPKAYSSGCFFELHFPCIVSMLAVDLCKEQIQIMKLG